VVYSDDNNANINRTLTVDYVIVNGTTYQAEGPTIIDYGSGNAAFDDIRLGMYPLIRMGYHLPGGSP